MNIDTIINAVENGIDNSAHTGKTKAIAVLPFNNISTEQETDYFSDGLTEELIMKAAIPQGAGIEIPRTMNA